MPSTVKSKPKHSHRDRVSIAAPCNCMDRFASVRIWPMNVGVKDSSGNPIAKKSSKRFAELVIGHDDFKIAVATDPASGVLVINAILPNGSSESLIRAELHVTNKQRGWPSIEGGKVDKIASSIAALPAPVAQLGEPELVARRLLDQHFNAGAHLRYERSCFFAFIGTHWQQCEEGKLVRLLLEIIRAHFPLSRQKLYRTAKESLAILKIEVLASDDMLRFTTAPAPVINVLNGEVWLNGDGTHELRPHDPNTGCRSVLVCAYDPQARSPLFDETVAEIFGKAVDPEEMIKAWEEIMGYVIQPSRKMAAYFILLGEGSNGKSGLTRLLGDLLGSAAVASLDISKLGGDRHGLANLVNKLLLIDDDVKAGGVLPDGLLKKLSEEKQLTADPKHKNGFNFINRAVPMLLCNSIPGNRDKSHGSARRVHVVKFDRQFDDAEQDRTRFDKIAATELPGVLNQALAGWRRVIENGYRFTPSKDMAAAKAHLLGQSTAVFRVECG